MTRKSSFKNEFSWSHSRYGTFNECLRRYYYNYYAYWGGWDAQVDPLTRKLYILKNLKNRYLWAGSVVHDEVAGILERVKAGLPLPNADEAAQKAVARMRIEFRQSRDGDYMQDPKRKLGLIEHHYQESVDDEVWRSFADMTRRSIGNFLAGPFLEAAQQLAPQDWLTLEDLLTFEVDGAKVYVKMDLAHRRPEGRAVILDWKTGKRTPKPEGLQLGCYALYATEAWDLAPEQIDVIEANINTGAYGSARITPEHLEIARAEITKGIRAMRARLADVANNVAAEDDFPANPSPRICNRCAFREACPEFPGELNLAPHAAAQSSASSS